MAQSLPTNCLELIFSYFDEFPGYDHDSDELAPVAGYWEQATDTLASCTLVCRDWVNLAQSALYKNINLGNMESESLAKFLSTVERSPSLARKVKVLHVEHQPIDDEHTVKRALAVLTNIEWYSLHVLTHIPRFPFILVPDQRHSKLTFLALLGDPIGGIGPLTLDHNTLCQLPTSIQVLLLQQTILPHIVTKKGSVRCSVATAKPTLPNLKRLCVIKGTLFASDTFERCTGIKSLYLFEPTLEMVKATLMPLSSQLETFKLSEEKFKWQDEFYPALTNLRTLDLTGNCISAKRLPSGLHQLVWAGLNEDNLFTLLSSLCDPTFLPNLKTIPALYVGSEVRVSNWYRYNEGEKASAYDVQLRQTLEALETRGITCENHDEQYPGGMKQIWAPRKLRKRMTFEEMLHKPFSEW